MTQLCVNILVSSVPPVINDKSQRWIAFPILQAPQVWLEVIYLVVEVFILKLLSINALTPSSILVGKVASLDHEFFDNCKKHKGKLHFQIRQSG